MTKSAASNPPEDAINRPRGCAQTPTRSHGPQMANDMPLDA